MSLSFFFWSLGSGAGWAAGFAAGRAGWVTRAGVPPVGTGGLPPSFGGKVLATAVILRALHVPRLRPLPLFGRLRAEVRGGPDERGEQGGRPDRRPPGRLQGVRVARLQDGHPGADRVADEGRAVPGRGRLREGLKGA